MTSYKVVLPFYLYAALSFLVTAILVLVSAPAFTGHYFHPHILAVTHAAALGWGTMIMLGASHQLVPVLAGTELFSHKLALICFILAAAGIPLLVYAFYVFNMGWPARWGGILVNAAVICFIVNLVCSIAKSKKENVQAIFLLTAVCWLLLTTSVGLALVYNFSMRLLPYDSLRYLPLHAHMGIVGWFLLLVMGVGSKLIPMFFISKYENIKLLWAVYFLVNGGLLGFTILFIFFPRAGFMQVPFIAVIAALFLFGFYCYKAFAQRIRKKLDSQMKISMLSVSMMLLPVVLISFETGHKMVLAYGFTIFFGWITAIILGMTFKTLPFIVWNRHYHSMKRKAKIPEPKILYSQGVFSVMSVIYLSGFVLFIAGILFSQVLLLRGGSVLLIIAAFLYNLNVSRILLYKPVVS